MPQRAWLLLLIAPAALCARDKIAYIEFFGYQGIDVDAVRRALPFHEGDQISVSSKKLADRARAAVKKTTGRDATDVSFVCCVNDGDVAIFIGLPGGSSHELELNPAPSGRVPLAAEFTKLYLTTNKAEEAAIRGGKSEEDGSAGYRLLKEPRAHAAELALRDYAQKHEDDLIRVLESSTKSEDRAMAADALGFGARTPRQIDALVHAIRDHDSDVRNNSVRALVEISGADPSVLALIRPDGLIGMVRSGNWTDRNKGSFALLSVTESRDPQLLARLKSEAGDALMEMAEWRAVGWASPARVILARIDGVPEEQINSLTRDLK